MDGFKRPPPFGFSCRRRRMGTPETDAGRTPPICSAHMRTCMVLLGIPGRTDGCFISIAWSRACGRSLSVCLSGYRKRQSSRETEISAAELTVIYLQETTLDSETTTSIAPLLPNGREPDQKQDPSHGTHRPVSSSFESTNSKTAALPLRTKSSSGLLSGPMRGRENWSVGRGIEPFLHPESGHPHGQYRREQSRAEHARWLQLPRTTFRLDSTSPSRTALYMLSRFRLLWQVSPLCRYVAQGTIWKRRHQVDSSAGWWWVSEGNECTCGGRMNAPVVVDLPGSISESSTSRNSLPHTGNSVMLIRHIVEGLFAAVERIWGGGNILNCGVCEGEQLHRGGEIHFVPSGLCSTPLYTIRKGVGHSRRWWSSILLRPSRGITRHANCIRTEQMQL